MGDESSTRSIKAVMSILHYLDMKQDTAKVINIHRMIRHLFDAVSIIAKAISSACCDELPTNIGPKRIKKVLASLVGIAFAALEHRLDRILKDCIDGILNDIVQCSLEAWSPNSTLMQQLSTSAISTSLEDLSDPILRIEIPYACKKCHALASIFSVRLDHRCFCFSSGINSSNSCTECVLPLNSR